MRICSVHTCYNTTGTRHRFPNPKKDRARFDMWIQRCGNSRLVQIDPLKVYNQHTVCNLHFNANDFFSNNKLQSTAVPVLHIPSGKVKNFKYSAIISSFRKWEFDNKFCSFDSFNAIC